MRVLVTGSRKWTDVRTVRAALLEVISHPPHDKDPLDNPPVLVVGRAPRGLDHLAEVVAVELGWTIEPYPADWSRGHLAGMERNTLMVESGADVCLAFPTPCDKRNCFRGNMPHGSHGTMDCATKARSAGIPVRFYREDHAP